MHRWRKRQLAQSKARVRAIGSSSTRTVPESPAFSSTSALWIAKAICENLEALGINTIYPWQSSCLLGRGLLDGQRNPVYSAPTGGGKSLMLKKVIDDPLKKAILVLPYVALVQEKLKWLRKAVNGVFKKIEMLNQPSSQVSRWSKSQTGAVRVAGLFAGSRATAGWSDFDVAVCTIEKVSSVTSRAYFAYLTTSRQTV